MKSFTFAAALIAVIWVWMPTPSADVAVEVDGTVKIAKEAGVNFLHLLGEEYEAAATLPATEAFDRIEDRQVVLRQSVLFAPIGKSVNEAAYGADGQGEFNQDAFSKVMREIASGLKSAR